MYLCGIKVNKCNKTMATTTAKQHTSHPMSYYWDVVKDMDDSQKLELVTMLIESVRPAVAKAEARDDEEYSLRPYTMEEINAMIDQSERDIAEGRVYDFDDVLDELEREFAEEDHKHEMAEAV